MFHLIPSSSRCILAYRSKRIVYQSSFRLISTTKVASQERTKEKPKRIRKSRNNSISSTSSTSTVGTQRQRQQFSQTQESSKSYEIFASTLPGLEPILSNELTKLNISNSDQRITDGGISFDISSIQKLYECHLHLGTASHLFLRAPTRENKTSFYVVYKSQIAQQVSQMDIWKELIPFQNRREMPRLEIRVSATKSKLYHTGMIADKVRKGIYKALDVDKDVSGGINNDNKKSEGPKLRILVRIHRDEMEISIDTSLTPLHRRGYKLDVRKAPLREDIAFGFLHALGWSQDESSSSCLIDPFCGSGTIVIEGACMVFGFPPGRLRPAPLQYTNFYDKNLWNDLIKSSMDDAWKKINMMKEDNEEEPSEEGQVNLPLIAGSDRNNGAAESTMRNAKDAGVDELIQVGTYPIKANPWLNHQNDSPPPSSVNTATQIPNKKMLIATNPPFGLRISPTKGRISAKKGGKITNAHPLLPLYQTLGNMVEKCSKSDKNNNDKHHKREVNVGILAHETKLARKTGIPNLQSLFTTRHGGISVTALGSRDTRTEAK
jgi:putative N6-adenine-specific DNA methylase